ncbi:succinylglutamate desuccinylase/aspartoacylase family protein [Paenibacillus koleovorans]|uniref:succinylglutamate desuccinylase/aspartoacylase family protein n=1 Tax=Paenibacillus koleovorans TaxID=121608 RepID=UPI000FDB6282|nr:succinylglutamate desuccinylase/aspartoacylase family protein [Paenibacillus koleovorans]
MMTFSDFSITRLSPGFKGALRLPLFASLGRELEMPVMAVKGYAEGPTLLVTAGIHGDEFEGMAAIRSVFQQLAPEKVFGSFIGLPVCNVLAYEHQTRESPPYADGLNLARVFPGKSTGSYTERLAYSLFEFVTRNLNPETDVLLDFHSGGTKYEFVPLIALHRNAPKRAEAEHLIRRFGIDRLWEIPVNPGTLNGAVSEYGITTIATETTGRGAAREEDIRQYVTGIHAVMHVLGMMESTDPAVNGKAIRTTVRQYFHTSGFFQSHVAIGDEVHSGQELGYVVNEEGERLESVIAEESGAIWAVRAFCSVYMGDLAFLIGTLPRDLERASDFREGGI